MDMAVPAITATTVSAIATGGIAVFAVSGLFRGLRVRRVEVPVQETSVILREIRRPE